MAEGKTYGSIKEYVLDVLKEQPNTDNETLAGMCRKMFRGASTTAASISSIKSNARRSGELEKTQVEELEAEELMDADTPETDEEILARIKKRFDAMDRMAHGVMMGVVPALIGAGPPGLGKSFSIEMALEKRKEEAEEAGFEFAHDYITGAISPVGLYISAWNHKEKGNVIVLDDCDSIFADEDSLNLLKAMLDSSSKRFLSWRKKSKWLEDYGIDDNFEFKGSVIFLSNLDFEKKIASGKGYAVHFAALMDRCLYLHLSIRTIRDSMIRIRQVVYEEGMLASYGLEKPEIDEIMDYVWENRKRFYHLSLRLIHQIALLQIADPVNWRADVEMTKMRADSEGLADTVKRIVEGQDVGEATAGSPGQHADPSKPQPKLANGNGKAAGLNG
jgi:DNA polymerase III delta prime subunit